MTSSVSTIRRSTTARSSTMLEPPILINRPIVVTERGARLCRPSERVLELIDADALGRFVKDDDEVIDGRTNGEKYEASKGY